MRLSRIAAAAALAPQWCFSTYHKVEITPRWMRTYALQDNYPVSYGLPNEYFEGIARYYQYLEYDALRHDA